MADGVDDVSLLDDKWVVVGQFSRDRPGLYLSVSTDIKVTCQTTAYHSAVSRTSSMKISFPSSNPISL